MSSLMDTLVSVGGMAVATTGDVDVGKVSAEGEGSGVTSGRVQLARARTRQRIIDVLRNVFTAWVLSDRGDCQSELYTSIS
jgi:hypothetical protein